MTAIAGTRPRDRQCDCIEYGRRGAAHREPRTLKAATHISVVRMRTAAQSVSIVRCSPGSRSSRSCSYSALPLHRMMVYRAMIAILRRQLRLVFAVPACSVLGAGNFAM